MSEGLVIRFGKVTSIEDPYGAGRIKARSAYDGPIEKNEELPFYIPILPKMLHIMPKVGELVLLISMAPGKFGAANYYIGPLISQLDKLYKEESSDALVITEQSLKNFDKNPEDKKGVLPTLYPDPEDISIEGRKDTGVQLKNEEVRIKAGVKVVDINGPKNNTTSPAFISLKYYPKNDYDLEGFKSTATIVADKINLVGTPAVNTDSATKEIPVTENKDMNAEDKDNLISDTAMKDLLNKAHRLPYGDILCEFLDLFRTAFVKHVHPFPTMAPCKDENVDALSKYTLEDNILSDTVRIN